MSTLTSHEAIKHFWEHITAEKYDVLCSSFSTQSTNILHKLSSEKASFADKCAVTAFLLETGALHLEVRRTEAGIESENIVLTKSTSKNDGSVKQSRCGRTLGSSRGHSPSLKNLEKKAKQNVRKLHVSLTKLKGLSKNCAQKDGSKDDRSSRIFAVATNQNESKDITALNEEGDAGALGQSNGVSGDDAADGDGAGPAARDPAIDLLTSMQVGRVKGHSAKEMQEKQNGDAEKERNIAENHHSVKRSRISWSSLGARGPDDRPVSKTKVLRSGTAYHSDHVDEDFEENDSYEAELGNDDDDDEEWKPESEDKEMAKRDVEEEEQVENDAALQQSTDQGTTVGKVYICQTCSDISHTTWDYDMHTISCKLAKEKSEYVCHLCKSMKPCTTKSGIVYHLILKHNFSGEDAMAKFPELDTKFLKHNHRFDEEDRGSTSISFADTNDEPDTEPMQVGQGKCDPGKDDSESNVLNLVNDTAEEHPVLAATEGKGKIEEQSPTQSDNDCGNMSISENTCKICHKEFVTASRMHRHAQTVHFGESSDHKCSTCGKFFSGAHKFKKHVRIHISKQKGKSFDCKLCGKVFNTQASLQNHIVIHTKGKNSHHCDQCDKKFTYNSSLRRHVIIHHQTERKLKCEECDRLFLNKRLLQDHMLRHTGIRGWKCDQCETACFTWIELKAHVRNSHQAPGQYLCDLCGSVYKSKGSLDEHHKTVHNDIKKFLCTLCGKGFVRRLHLIDHEKMHAEDWPYQCDVCKKPFHYQYEFQAHVKREHSALQPLHCEICDRMFFEKSSLEHHREQGHKGGGDIFCEYCGATCRDHGQLQQHLSLEHKTHVMATSKPMECGNAKDTEQSQQRYQDDEHRRNSMATKSLPLGPRTQYKCDSCNETFLRKFNYRLHMMRHKGLEPLACKICGKHFLAESSLKCHVTTIHNEPSKRWSCDECGDFSCKAYKLFREHMNTTHGIHLPSDSRKIKRIKNPVTSKSKKASQVKVDSNVLEAAVLSEQSSSSSPMIMVNNELDVANTITDVINEMIRAKETQDIQPTKSGTIIIL